MHQKTLSCSLTSLELGIWERIDSNLAELEPSIRSARMLELWLEARIYASRALDARRAEVERCARHHPPPRSVRGSAGLGIPNAGMESGA